MGICQMPTFIVGPAIAEGKLVTLLSEYELPKHAIYALLPHRKYIPAKVRAFMECLQSNFDQDIPYWDKA